MIWGIGSRWSDDLPDQVLVSRWFVLMGGVMMIVVNSEDESCGDVVLGLRDEEVR